MLRKILLATVLLLPAAALADTAAEISTAQDHAALAANATTLKMVHTHLHHALNCLVGPGNHGFDTKVANPCAGQGNGAIPDSTSADQKKSLRMTMKTLRAGIKSTDMTTAQSDATDAATQLKALH